MAKANGIIGSLLWKSGERIMVQGIGLLVQIILARLLMPEDFASLAIITAIVNYLGIFVQCGLSAAVVQKKDLSEIDVSTLTTLSLLVALILYVENQSNGYSIVLILLQFHTERIIAEKNDVPNYVCP